MTTGHSASTIAVLADKADLDHRPADDLDGTTTASDVLV
jgi:hypothetical protein